MLVGVTCDDAGVLDVRKSARTLLPVTVSLGTEDLMGWEWYRCDLIVRWSACQGIKGPCSKCGGKGRSSSGGSASPSRGEAPRKAHGPVRSAGLSC